MTNEQIPGPGDLDRSVRSELDFWRDKAAENEAIIGFLVALAFRRKMDDQ